MNQGRRLKLEWSEHRGRSSLRIAGWAKPEFDELGGLTAAELARRLVLLPSQVLKTGAARDAVPSTAGRFEFGEGFISFAPRFPFVDGMAYSLLVYSGSGEDAPEVWAVERAAAPVKPTTEVTAIYPTASEVPVNLLKVYVHFSAPMSEGWADRAIRVCREDTGEELEGVFLPPYPELWDPERRRLTMLLDPGRIKRGLVPNLESGYPLIEGVPIRVIVAPDFRDSRGQTLIAGAERSYQVGPPLRSRIKASGIKWWVPSPGSLEPLVVEFDRPLDHALMHHALWVMADDADRAAVPGQGVIGPEERSWRFNPERPWQQGHYFLVCEPSLEDLAGNSTSRVFDRDITVDEDVPGEPHPLGLGFFCGPIGIPAEPGPG